MNSYLMPKISSFCVAYRDVGEEREQGKGSFENLRNSRLLRAICALNLNILGTTYFAQNKSEAPL